QRDGRSDTIKNITGLLITRDDLNGDVDDGFNFRGKRRPVVCVSEGAGAECANVRYTKSIDGPAELLHRMNRAEAGVLRDSSFIDACHADLYRLVIAVQNPVSRRVDSGNEQVKRVGAHIDDGDFPHKRVKG